MDSGIRRVYMRQRIKEARGLPGDRVLRYESIRDSTLQHETPSPLEIANRYSFPTLFVCNSDSLFISLFWQFVVSAVLQAAPNVIFILSVIWHREIWAVMDKN